MQITEMEFGIAPTWSNKPRKCHSCGCIIPARAQSIKHTKRVRGTIGAGTKYSRNVTFYTCVECVDLHGPAAGLR